MFTIKKISLVTLFAVALFAASFLFVSNVSAQTTGGGGTGCSGCGGGGSTGGGSTGGDGGDGGGDTPVTPVCKISIDKTVAAYGETYKLSWEGTPSNALFYINGQRVAAKDSANYTFDSENYERFVLKGDNGGPTCEAEVRINRAPVAVPAPVCTLTASPTTINRGGTSTLTWTTQNASTVTLVRPNSTAAVAANGSTVVEPLTTFTFVLRATNSAGVSVECPRVVTVIQPPTPVPAPICVLNANPTSITAGGSSQLSWTSQNAVSASINQGIGNVALNGNRSVNPGSNTTYTMTVTNSAGVTATCARTITVTATPAAPVCESFTASPSTINRGNSSTLTWNTTNASTVTINNGVGSVSADGSINVSPLTTTTYTLTATGAGGTVTCPTTVNVNVPSATFTCENNVNFNASPRNITRGNSSTLTWSTNGVTSLYFDRDISSTRLNGSVSVSPSSDTTYTMYASNGSRTISCPVTVDVSNPGGGGGGGGTIYPRCDISASATKVSRGGAVKLTWTSRDARNIILEDNHGKEYIDSDDRDSFNDNLTVYPTRDTTYTIIVERGSVERKCSVKVTVDNLIVKEVRDQKPVVTGISLTEVPYTGFEAGPFMTVAFYMLLVLWALYLAYALVIRRTPAFASIATDVPASPRPGQIIPSDVLVATTATPNFHAPAPAAVEPTGVQYGYGGVVNDETANEVENRAHAAHVLFSGEAMRYFMSTTNPSNRMSALEKVLDEAKASYPAEDGWVVLNEERVAKTCEVCFANKPVAATPSFTPNTVTVGNSSLAEAIVTGNIVAAYQMIGNRPMIALADTAADLDALYRAKQGADVTVSKLLAHADVKTEQLHNAIAALTGALDGTYTDEGEAVKMAIMKAVKAIHG